MYAKLGLFVRIEMTEEGELECGVSISCLSFLYFL